jgi:hypothetical protein
LTFTVLKRKKNWQTMSEGETETAFAGRERALKEYQQFPELNHADNGYRRIRYVRYAGDFGGFFLDTLTRISVLS